MDVSPVALWQPVTFTLTYNVAIVDANATVNGAVATVSIAATTVVVDAVNTDFTTSPAAAPVVVMSVWNGVDATVSHVASFNVSATSNATTFGACCVGVFVLGV